MSRSSKTSAPTHIDYLLMVIIFILIGYGAVMQFSASYALNPAHPYRVIIKHGMWLALGLTGMFLIMQVDYHLWQNLAIPAMMITMILLALVLLIGEEGEGGARRHLRGGSIQPSELAKLAIIIYIAAWLASKGKKISDLSMGLIPFGMIMGFFLSLIILEPDISTSALIALTAIAMFIVAGADLIQIAILLLSLAAAFGLAVTRQDYAIKRINQFLASFVAPWNSPDLQTRTGYFALKSGGLFGKGLAQGQYKLGHLPLIHSDSIFAVVGEELGLLGALVVIALFLALAYRGVHIALQAKDDFGRLLAFGITTWVTLQAFINIAVITVVIPNTGMPLPFFSYGGSNTLLIMAGLGILLNISKNGQGSFSLHAPALFRRRNRRARVSRAHRRSRS